MKKKITWLENVDKEHLDSVWYGGDIVKIEYKNYICTIIAAGDVKANINGEIYCDKNESGRFRQFLNENGITNDKELQTAIENGNVIFYDNNWFEIVVWDNKNKDYLDLGFDTVVDIAENDNFDWVIDFITEN